MHGESPRFSLFSYISVFPTSVSSVWVDMSDQPFKFPAQTQPEPGEIVEPPAFFQSGSTAFQFGGEAAQPSEGFSFVSIGGMRSGFGHLKLKKELFNALTDCGYENPTEGSSRSVATA